MNDGALIVNFFGGPGIGKSTCMGGVFTLLKIHGVECELVTEYAKDLVWEERQKTFKNQNYIFAKQHHRIWRVFDQVDVVVTDCPLMLSPVYNEYYNNDSKIFNYNVVDTVNKFNNLNIILSRKFKYNENGRNQTEEQAIKLDKIVKGTLEKFNMDWIEIDSSLEGINEIAQVLIKDKIKYKFSTV